jgi:uncharacterized protein (DUF362 family)
MVVRRGQGSPPIVPVFFLFGLKPTLQEHTRPKRKGTIDPEAVFSLERCLRALGSNKEIIAQGILSEASVFS